MGRQTGSRSVWAEFWEQGDRQLVLIWYGCDQSQLSLKNVIISKRLEWTSNQEEIEVDSTNPVNLPEDKGTHESFLTLG